jgi:hypothetical protein
MMTKTPENVHKIVLQTEEGPRAFHGYCIVDLSLDAADVVDPPERLRRDPRYRWTDMALYRVVDEQVNARYAVHVVGRSVLYHRVGSPCQKGVTRTVGALDEDPRYDLLRPCQDAACFPGTDWHHMETLADSDKIDVEEERPTLLKCVDAKDLLRQLRGRDGEISGLASKLLREGAGKDDGVAAVLYTERSL